MKEKQFQPDIPAPKNGKETSGFTFNAYTKQVEQAWSSQSSHGIGYASQKEQRKQGASAAQGSIALYSTRMRALLGLKHALDLQHEKILQQVDAKISAEKQRKSSTSPDPEQRIVDETEELAREFARLLGRQVAPAILLRHSRHPRARTYWTLACAAQEILCKTDVSNALANIDDDDEPKE